MNILVIEDELKTARALIKLISTIKPDSVIHGPLQKVSSSVDHLSHHPAPDLIFMDIQLSDGLSFEIFQKIEVSSPVIFCTAFDEYALDAFKANGIDYILKPFSADSLRSTFNKLDRLGLAKTDSRPDLSRIWQLLHAHQPDPGKQSFLVFKNGKYQTIGIERIAYFFVKNETTTIATFQNEFFSIDQSLDETTNQVDSKSFFKINRQYLVAFRAVKEVEHFFARKLLVKLAIPTDEKLLVGKDKTTLFLNWLDKR